jgi:glycosyltransferase involved in cell wall biosynthesis
MAGRIRVLDIDADSIPTELDGLEGYAGIRGLVRLHGAPLGYIEVPVVNGRVSGKAIRRAVLRLHHWPLIRHKMNDALALGVQPRQALLGDMRGLPHPAFPAYEPFVTVAVCTRDRTTDLALCLDALMETDYENVEFIVVDNAPATDSTRELVTSRYPRVRYVVEPRPGLDWARNRAIVEARGEIVAYTDDDVVVDRGWVRAIVGPFATPDVMAVTGLVVPYELETEAQMLFERYGGFGRGFERRWFRDVKGLDRHHISYLGSGQFGTGANMAYRREVFRSIGMFDPALDVGTVTNGGGDLEMFFRVLKEGHTLVYEPGAIVRHRHRREYEKLRTQIANNGIGLYSHFVRSALYYPDERKAALRIGLWWLWWWNIRRYLISFIRPARFPREIILAELKGCFIGLTRYQQARRIAEQLARDVETYGPVATFPIEPQPPVPLRDPQHLRVAVRHVELHEPLTPIRDLEEYDAVRVFVTRDDVPLGDFTLHCRTRAIGTEQLRDALAANIGIRLVSPDNQTADGEVYVEAQSALMDAYAEYPEADERDEPARLPDDVPVTVVLATYDRPDDLRACLTYLTCQKTRRPFEIIVVDNHPASGLTPPVVAAFPGVRLLSEERQGRSYASNRGFIASRGAITIATDDDVIFPPDWLERIVAPFAQADVMAVTGNVLPLELETKAQRLFEEYGGLSRGYHRFEAGFDWFNSFRRRGVPTWELGATANVAFRTVIFRDPQIGMLDETLGAGVPTGCSEDTYLFYKILKAGHTIVYEPAAYVWHKHRREMHALRRQLYNYSKGHVALHLTTLVNDGDPRGLFDIFIRLPRWRMRQLATQVRRGFKGQKRFPLSLVLAETAGNLAGPYALWQARRRVAQLGRVTFEDVADAAAVDDAARPDIVEELALVGRG